MRLAQVHCLLENRVEDRLQVARRAADDLEDLRSRGLTLERLLRFVEQPHVLDRDRRLVGERLQQRNLLVAERPDLHSAQEDHAECSAFTQQWDSQRSAMPKATLYVPPQRIFGF